jgi:hypothetical protein
LSFELNSLVKFFKRILNRRYKGKNHKYIRYALEIPARFNSEAALFFEVVFDEINVTTVQTSKEDVLHITLIKNKRQTKPLPAT